MSSCSLVCCCTGKVPSYCGIGSMCNLKNMTVVVVSDSVSSLSSIFDVALIAFQAKNKIVALTGAIPGCVVGTFYLVSFLLVPNWEILLQYFQKCGLLQLLELKERKERNNIFFI